MNPPGVNGAGAIPGNGLPPKSFRGPNFDGASVSEPLTLPDDPATSKLAKVLEIDIPTAIGCVFCLHVWAVSFAPDGDLDGFDPEDVADGAHFQGDPGAFVDSLLRFGFLTGDREHLMIAGWKHTGGRLVEFRRDARERKARQRAGHSEVTVTSL